MRKLWIGCVLLATAALVPAERAGLWKVIGPGGGGAQFYPTISPHDKKRVLVACDMTGAYLTEDGGASWRMFNLRGTVRAFVWDPRDAKVIYALGNGLFRSSDGGQSWKLVYPAPERVTGVEMSSDHADEQILVDASLPSAWRRWPSIRVIPRCCTRPSEPLFRVSEDGGASWRKERDFPARVRRIWAGPRRAVCGRRPFHLRPRKGRVERGSARPRWRGWTSLPRRR